MPLIGTVGGGAQITSGTAAPDPANGVDGDVYLLVDVVGVVLKAYQKVAGVWATIGSINSAWLSYTPTITASSGTFVNATGSFVYKFLENIVYILGAIVIADAGTASGVIRSTLPQLPANNAYGSGIGGGLAVNVQFLSSNRMDVTRYDGASIISAPLIINFSGFYQV